MRKRLQRTCGRKRSKVRKLEKQKLAKRKREEDGDMGNTTLNKKCNLEDEEKKRE